MLKVLDELISVLTCLRPGIISRSTFEESLRWLFRKSPPEAYGKSACCLQILYHHHCCIASNFTLSSRLSSTSALLLLSRRSDLYSLYRATSCSLVPSLEHCWPLR